MTTEPQPQPEPEPTPAPEQRTKCPHCHGGKFRPHSHNVRSVP